jgi:hypothetical protein
MMFMMGRAAKVLLGMMIVLLPATVFAQALPRFEITPFAGYRIGGTFADSASDAEIELEAGSSFGISLNMLAEANTQYEITFSHQDTEFDIGSLATSTTNLDVAVDYLQVGGTYLLEGQIARPYVVATVGLARVDPDDAIFNTENYFAFSVGGGWKLWPTKRFGLRLEGRVYGSFVDSDTSVFCISSGGTTCLIQSDGDMLWQWEMTAGASWRF